MIDLRAAGADAASVIRALDLRPHPEGGHFRETWRDHPRADRARGAGKESPLRGAGTAILFLLARGERSHWHRVDASELWVWQAGASLDLRIHGTDDVALGPDGTRFGLRTPWGDAEIATHLVGRFNVENALAAAASSGLAGIPLDAIVAGLGTLPGVPGRLEVVTSGRPFAVIVDYAHTPDALDNVLRAVRPLATGRVTCVFGCGGDRDRGKRPEMARVACALADRVVLTTDNPRSEDPLAIIAEIRAGADARVEVEPDRRAAIERAIADAEAGDVVLIAGKGHEQGQEAQGVVTPFDDRAVAREVLA